MDVISINKLSNIKEIDDIYYFKELKNGITKQQ